MWQFLSIYNSEIKVTDVNRWVMRMPTECVSMEEKKFQYIHAYRTWMNWSLGYQDADSRNPACLLSSCMSSWKAVKEKERTSKFNGDGEAGEIHTRASSTFRLFSSREAIFARECISPESLKLKITRTQANNINGFKKITLMVPCPLHRPHIAVNTFPREAEPCLMKWLQLWSLWMMMDYFSVVVFAFLKLQIVRRRRRGPVVRMLDL